MADEIGQEAKNGGVINKGSMYSIIASKFPQIFEALTKGLDDSNPAVRLGAARTLLNKILPDLRDIEINNGVDENGKARPFQLLINAGSGFIPATIQFNVPSTGSAPTEQQTVQDTNLAPESTQDDNSNIRDSEAGSS